MCCNKFCAVNAAAEECISLSGSSSCGDRRIRLGYPGCQLAAKVAYQPKNNIKYQMAKGLIVFNYCTPLRLRSESEPEASLHLHTPDSPPMMFPRWPSILCCSAHRRSLRIRKHIRKRGFRPHYLRDLLFLRFTIVLSCMYFC